MQEFERCPFGIIGLETALGLAIEHLHRARSVGVSDLIALFTSKPARILSINRGTLQVGAAADITIFGLDHAWTYDVNRSASKSRNTPFNNHQFCGGPVATIVNGSMVWKFEG